MEFTVIRTRWLRGGRDGEGYDAEATLLDFGQSCCLGFLGAACGIFGRKRDSVEAALKKASEPEDCKTIDWPESIVTVDEGYPHNSALTHKIIEVNDNKTITDEAREARLTRLFAEGGIQVTFVDE